MVDREIFVHRLYTKARNRLQPYWRQVDDAFRRFCENPAHPSLRFERLNREELWWSYRVNDDIRTIVSEADDCWIVCYVNHHDDAYQWVSRRHPILDRSLGEFAIPPKDLNHEIQIRHTDWQDEPAPSRPLSGYSVQQLRRLGIPTDAMAQAMIDANQDSIENLLFWGVTEGWFSEEVWERIDLLLRGRPYRELLPPSLSVLISSDLLRAKPREFWRPESLEEIDKMIDMPWDEWVIYLHPAQKRAVQIDSSGPVRITGGAGTGKTVVAVHRTYYTAEKLYASQPGRILLTTYTGVLAENLKRLLLHPNLLGEEDMLRLFQIEVMTLHSVAHRLYSSTMKAQAPLNEAQVNIAQETQIRNILREYGASQTEFSEPFLWMEWTHIIDAWNVRSLEQYLAIERIGRRAPLQPTQRERLWEIFSKVWEWLESNGLTTFNQVCYQAAEFLNRHPEHKYRYVIVDEAQDFGPAELTLVRALASDQPNSLFICADTRQRIYRPAVPWIRFGIDTRGRSYILRVNYRTTRQIQQFAEQVLPATIEGVQEDERELLRERPHPVLSGPEPECHGYENIQAEIRGLKEWVYQCLQENIQPGEIAIFARSHKVVEERIMPALNQIQNERSIGAQKLDRNTPILPSALNYGTAHSAKGLEFRAVAIVGATSGHFPSYAVLSQIDDPRERQEAEMQERQLFYTVCTRAREKLYISWAPTNQKTPFLREC